MPGGSDIIARAAARGLTVATAESCTGGLIAAALTAAPGASAAFTHGFVTYSNAAKVHVLGVPATLIARFGAVSPQVARAMARGARRASGANIAVSVTGIAGPDGGRPGKPVGTVYIGLAGPGGRTVVWPHRFSGDRAAVRAGAVRAALGHLARALQP
jgi:nicotinamide-nucleotide amidase